MQHKVFDVSKNVSIVICFDAEAETSTVMVHHRNVGVGDVTDVEAQFCALTSAIEQLQKMPIVKLG